jgi:putative transposase
MPYRKVAFRTGDCYHLFNRGNNRQPIFFEPDNYRFFLRRARKYLNRDVADLIAYCLMPNHYHLLVHLRSEELPKAMQLLSLSYTNAVNERYGRVGSLFQGRYHAVAVETDEQLLHLSRYIHLNPVAAGLVARPQDWRFSSYDQYVGLRGDPWLNPGMVLSHFDPADSYRAFVESHVDSRGKLSKVLTID